MWGRAWGREGMVPLPSGGWIQMESISLCWVTECTPPAWLAFSDLHSSAWDSVGNLWVPASFLS